MTLVQRDARIKIAFFDEAVAFGGSVVVLAHLLDHIDRKRFQPLVVTSLDRASIEKLFRPEDLLCWFRPRLSYADRERWMSRCPSSVAVVRRVWAYLFSVSASIVNLPQHVRLYYKIWRAKPAIVHANNGKEGLMASRLFKTAFLVHLHGISAAFLADRLRAAHFVGISKYVSAEAIKCGVAPGSITDIPNPAPVFKGSSVTDAEWRARFGLPEDAIVFAHVGRVLRWKGQLEFLQAFAEVAPVCPKAYALIVGDDMEGLSSEYPRSLRRLVSERGLEGRVVFTGHIGNIVELMAFADVVVHSSIDPEPFGLVITEAMIAGAAVIAARLGAPIELIDEGVTGLLVDPKNTQEFAQALALMVNDEPARKRMAAAGQRDANEKYSPAAFARRFEAVYEKMVRRAAGEPHANP